MKKEPISFAFKFTLIILLTIIFIAGSLSAVFFINFYSICYKLARTDVEKSINNLRDNIAFSLETYAVLLENTSYGISAILEQGPLNKDALSSYFEKLISKLPEVELLYFSGNTLWNAPDGFWVSSPEWIPNDDWDQRQRPWYVNAKRAEGETVFSEPFLDSNTGGIIISISRVVYDSQGRDIGVVAADMLVTKLNAQITNTKVFTEQELYLLNNDGFYITNPDPEKIMTLNFFDEPDFNKFYHQVFTSETFHIQDNDFDFFSAKIPFTQWYLVSKTPNSVVFAETNTFILRISLLCIFVFIAASIISVLMINFMLTKPLKELLHVAASLASMDFTAKFSKLNSNEIGQMQKALIHIRTNMQKVLISLGNNADMVSAYVVELSSSAKEITATANEQASSIAEIVSTMENNKNLSQEAAVKTVDVANLALQTQEISSRGAQIRSANEKMMLDIKNQNLKITDVIDNLSDILSRIDELVEVIDNIADNTKMIAFNATLEASSAGDAGIRFSVVAGEIRRFADNVAESVSEIKEKITELQGSSQSLITEAANGTKIIDEGYNRIVEQKEIFENIVLVSNHVAERSQQITSLSKQQELAASQVFTVLKELSTGVRQFVTATSITSDSVDKLNSMAIELKETLEKYHIIYSNE